MIDLAAELRNALRDPGVRSELRALVVEAVRDAMPVAPKPPALEPLSSILGVSAAAARMRAARDPELERLGVKIGRRTLYGREGVIALLRERRRRATTHREMTTRRSSMETSAPTPSGSSS